MNEPGDIPLTHSSTPDTQPCSLTSIIPALGMSSCRGRAEAFARRLSSKLRTLGSQTDDESTSQEDEPIINGGSTNTWVTTPDSEQPVTDLQPLRHESDSFFDFDCDLESPGSPVDECEYLRLIETASNTPHNSVTESGYACASAASSHSSNDGPYFDIANTDSTVAIKQPKAVPIPAPIPPPPPPPPSSSMLARTLIPVSALPEYVNSVKVNGSADRLSNGVHKDETNESLAHITEIQSTIDAQSNRTTDETRALPTTGPDVESMSSVPNLAGRPEHLDMIVSEMVRVQDEIINELQKQSEQFIVTSTPSTDNGHCNTTDLEAQTEATMAAQTPAEPEQTICEIVHTITNGHDEDEEEVLQIELTETEKAATQAAVSEEQLEKELNGSEAKDAEKKSIETKEIATEPKIKENQQLGLDTTDDEDELRPQRVRRCSSLKTGKTPPGTPGRKKIVRFADVLGLDLADVKTFLDEIPTIPKSAFEDLEIMESEPPIQLGPKSDKLLMPLFQQPGGLSTFLDLVREKQVSLENAAVTEHINQTITGSVRVRNLDFHKSVHIRYSLDGWRSYADLQANYVENSCDGFSDKFTFVLFGNSLHIGQRLEFAVRFQCKGQQFWDNNYGTNYCFQCLPSSSPASNPIQPIVSSHHTNHLVGILSPTAGDAWCSSFY